MRRGVIPLRAFLRRPPEERWLLAEAFLFLCIARIAVWVLPERTVLRLAPGSPRRLPAAPVASCLDVLPTTRGGSVPGRGREGVGGRVAWALEVAGRRVPRCTPLVRALAGGWLLARRGWRSQVWVGVKRREPGTLRAHAWLECDGTVIVGGDARPYIAPFDETEDEAASAMAAPDAEEPR